MLSVTAWWARRAYFCKTCQWRGRHHSWSLQRTTPSFDSSSAYWRGLISPVLPCRTPVNGQQHLVYIVFKKCFIIEEYYYVLMIHYYSGYIRHQFIQDITAWKYFMLNKFFIIISKSLGTAGHTRLNGGHFDTTVYLQLLAASSCQPSCAIIFHKRLQHTAFMNYVSPWYPHGRSSRARAPGAGRAAQPGSTTASRRRCAPGRSRPTAATGAGMPTSANNPWQCTETARIPRNAFLSSSIISAFLFIWDQRRRFRNQGKLKRWSKI